MASSTSFHSEQALRPSPNSNNSPGLPPPMNFMGGKTPLDPAALMLYYQSMAEKCWGLNSPPGSDSSSTSNRSSANSSQGKTQLFGGKCR